MRKAKAVEKQECVHVRVKNLVHEPHEFAYQFETMQGKTLWWPQSDLQVIGCPETAVYIISVRKDFAERNGLTP